VLTRSLREHLSASGESLHRNLLTLILMTSYRASQTS
jgi:hypothetical protein